MVGILQPLDQKFALVKPDGTPTDYFIRWAQQKQIDIGDSINLTDLQTYLTEHSLREGSGIQFTPSGDLNDSPLIAADVQEILDQITATRGTVLYRGLLGWSALLPGTAGNFLKTNGAGADPEWAAGGGGGGGYGYECRPTIPVLAAFTQLNFSGTTFTASPPNSIVIGDTTVATQQVRGLVRAAPAVPFTLYARMQPSGAPMSGGNGGFLLRNSATGRLLIFHLGNNNAVSMGRWNSLTSWSSTPFGPSTLDGGYPPWFKLDVSATTVFFSFSRDGYTWSKAGYTENIATWIAAIDQVGYCNISHTNPEYLQIFSDSYTPPVF